MKVKENNLLKIIIILISAILILGQISIATTTGTINSETVRVREKPTTDSNIVALVSIGDKVQIIEKSGDWYKISCNYEGENVTGYIRGDLIDVNKDSSTSQAQEPTPTTTITQEPETTSSEPTNVSEQTPENNDNSNSNETTQSSNISKDNEMIDNSLTVLSIPQIQKKEGSRITLTQDINIKILPVVNSNNIATIKSGTDVTVVEVMNKWIRVENEEQIGWVRIDT